MKPTVFTPLATICLAIAPAMMPKSCGIWNTHAALSAAGAKGARAICGVLLSAATSSTAVEVGVAVEPMMTSTLSSDTSLRAFLDAAVGSVASYNVIHLLSANALRQQRDGVLFRYAQRCGRTGGGQGHADVDVRQRRCGYAGQGQRDYEFEFGAEYASHTSSYHERINADFRREKPVYPICFIELPFGKT